MFRDVLSFLKPETRYYVATKRNYYQSRQNRIDSWEKLYKLSQGSDDVSIADDKQINFFSVPFGLNQKAIIKKFGKPRHVLSDNCKIKGHEIYFYKFNFHGVLAKSEIHFLNNSFFLASYFFNRTIDDVSNGIADIILNKYMDGERLHFNNKFQLVDKDNNKLIFEKDVDYVVTYFSGSPLLNQCIMDKIQEEESKKINSKRIRESVLTRAL